MKFLWLRIRPYISIFVRYMRISYLELKSNYEGTALGLVWVPVSTLSFTLLLSFVFHGGGKTPAHEFFLYVLSGFVCWNFISDSINGSTKTIQTKLDFAVHNNLSLGGLFGKTLADRGFEFGLELAVLMAAVLLISPFSYGAPILLLPFLLAMLALVSLAASYIINLVTLFAPDLANVVGTGVRLMFFATPIFWKAESAGDTRILLEHWNPASYYLAMMRQTFGIEPFQLHIWLIGVAITAVVAAVGYFAFQRTSPLVRNLK